MEFKSQPYFWGIFLYTRYCDWVVLRDNSGRMITVVEEIIIVGAGAAGMTAAIAAAREGAKVCLLEHTDRVGKKILVTGNGRCNFTNQDMSSQYFHGGSKKWVQRVLDEFGHEQAIQFFDSLGIFPCERNGYCYPASEQAASILDALRWELEYRKVSIQTGCEITSIRRQGKNFLLTDRKGTDRSAKALILACGSKAAPKTGSDGSGYLLARKLGHTIEPVVPALTCLKTDGKEQKLWAGVRAKGLIAVWADGICLEQNYGELQLTEYGVSGIPVFQVSRHASLALLQKKEVEVVLDFLPNDTMEECGARWNRRMRQLAHLRIEDALNGQFNKKLTMVFLRRTNINPNKRCGEMKSEEVNRLVREMKQMRLSVTGTGDFLQAQVCAGGVSLQECDAASMQSKIVNGLYFAGEILDVDGMCGGYNLQFAWSSGYLAGVAAAQRVTAMRNTVKQARQPRRQRGE